MEKLTNYFVLVIIAIFPFFNFSQSSYSPEDQTRAINAHFLGEQLQAIAVNEPLRYDAIQYYFKSSFTVVSLTCPSCEVNMDEFFNTHLFDVANFESSRLTSEEFTFEFKNDFAVTLLPLVDVNEALGLMSLESLLSRKVNRPFPIWSIENPQSAFGLYKNEVQEWQRDFPDEFKEMYNSVGFYKISFSEFQLMPHDKQLNIMSNEAGYLLID